MINSRLDTDYADFFETFGRAVLARLPEDVRGLAEAQLDEPEGDQLALMIILAHAGRARRAAQQTGGGDALRLLLDEAIAQAAAALRRALFGRMGLRLVASRGGDCPRPYAP